MSRVNIHTKGRRDHERACTCGHYDPYEPKGICAPMMEFGACYNCRKLDILVQEGCLQRDDVVGNPDGAQLIREAHDQYFNDCMLHAITMRNKL